jgi:hypothetical protein
MLSHEDSNAALRQSDQNWKTCGQLRVVSSDHMMVPFCRLVSDVAEISDADAMVSASHRPSPHNNVNSIEVASDERVGISKKETPKSEQATESVVVCYSFDQRTVITRCLNAQHHALLIS